MTSIKDREQEARPWLSPDVEQAVRRQLEYQRDMLPNLPGFHYRGKDDLLLQHGRFFEPQDLPKAYRRGRARACFANSLRLGTKAGLRYVEGVALPDVGILVHHAWCLDERDRVVDPTWSTPGRAYFGVVFAKATVVGSWEGDQNSVLDDWPHGWPVLREPYSEADELDLSPSEDAGDGSP